MERQIVAISVREAIACVRDEVGANNPNGTVQGICIVDVIVSRFLAQTVREHPTMMVSGLLLDHRGPVGNFDGQVFYALAANGPIEYLVLPSDLDIDSVLVLLQLVAWFMRQLKIYFAAELTEDETDKILQACAATPSIAIVAGACTNGMASSIKAFLGQSSSLRNLSLIWMNGIGTGRAFRQDVVAPLMDGIATCTSLRSLAILRGPHEADSNTLARLVVSSVVDAKFHRNLSIQMYSEQENFFRQVRDGLLMTEKVKSMRLLFGEHHTETYRELTVFRHPLARHVLASTSIPLKRWPSVLVEGSKCYEDDDSVSSHIPLDFIFFMMKEKNDIILRNVGR